MFFIFNINPRFPSFLLHVRCKSWVTFIRRSFRDVDGIHLKVRIIVIVIGVYVDDYLVPVFKRK